MQVRSMLGSPGPTGHPDDALRRMQVAADLDDRREKSIGMENSPLPMRELLGEFLLETGKPGAAEVEFEKSVRNAPNRPTWSSARGGGVRRQAEGTSLLRPVAEIGGQCRFETGGYFRSSELSDAMTGRTVERSCDFL
jgi:hypothetical protein